MIDGVYYIIGSGTTTRAIMEGLNLPYTLLGVDIIKDKKLIRSDCSEKDILQIVGNSKSKLIITPTGGQGYLLGRGNQQISDKVVKKIGKENREKAGNVAETALRVYGAKKLVDAVNWFNKNFKLPSGNKGTNMPESLTKTLQTMNVNASVVNVYGKNMGAGGSSPVAGVPAKSTSSSNGEAIPLPGTVAKIGVAKNLIMGIYVPEEYEVGGEKYKEFENKLLNIREDKKNKKTEKDNLNSNMNLYSLRDSNGFKLNPLGATNAKDKEQIDAAIKLMNTNVIDELLKLKNLESNISMQNQINVEAPKVDARVYIDGKNIPVQRVEIDYRKVEKYFETQSQRYGRPV